jgi:hypothetical protein
MMRAILAALLFGLGIFWLLTYRAHRHHAKTVLLFVDVVSWQTHPDLGAQFPAERLELRKSVDLPFPLLLGAEFEGFGLSDALVKRIGLRADVSPHVVGYLQESVSIEAVEARAYDLIALFGWESLS